MLKFNILSFFFGKAKSSFGRHLLRGTVETQRFVPFRKYTYGVCMFSESRNVFIRFTMSVILNYCGPS